MRRQLIGFLCLLCICSGISACGQKGPLRFPPEPAKPNQQEPSMSTPSMQER